MATVVLIVVFLHGYMDKLIFAYIEDSSLDKFACFGRPVTVGS